MLNPLFCFGYCNIVVRIKSWGFCLFIWFYEGYTTSWLSLQTLVLIWWCRWCQRQLQISRESSKKFLWKCSFGKGGKWAFTEQILSRRLWAGSSACSPHSIIPPTLWGIVLSFYIQQMSLSHRDVKNSENYGSGPRSIPISHCLYALQSLWFGSPFQRRTSGPILINCGPWANLSW